MSYACHTQSCTDSFRQLISGPLPCFCLQGPETNWAGGGAGTGGSRLRGMAQVIAKLTLSRAGKDPEQLELSYVAGQSGKFVRRLVSFLRSDTSTWCDTAISLLAVYLEK